MNDLPNFGQVYIKTPEPFSTVKTPGLAELHLTVDVHWKGLWPPDNKDYITAYDTAAL